MRSNCSIASPSFASEHRETSDLAGRQPAQVRAAIISHFGGIVPKSGELRFLPLDVFAAAATGQKQARKPQ
jgi:hypothetical protein